MENKPGKGKETFSIVLNEKWLSSEDMIPKYWQEELRKCKESSYYFYTTYMTVNGLPVTTHLTEEEFNKQFQK